MAEWLGPHQELIAARLGSSSTPELRAEERAIHDLLVAYTVHYDMPDVDALVDLFAEDAVYTTALGVFRGRAEIRRNYEHLLAQFARAMHFIGNVTIRAESATSAQAASYMQAFVVRRDGFAYGIGGLYQDRLTKQAGRWQIAERTVTDGVVYRMETMDPGDRVSHQ